MNGAKNKNLVLAAMVFAVAMTFIDQTIVAIAVPDLEKDLSLSPTGSQWIINGYLLSLSALFAFGGKLGDVNQANNVPAGSLDAGWGDIAGAAVEAAASGIFELINKFR